MVKIGVILLAALLAVCDATHSSGVLYPFDINSLLECHIPNPFYRLPGQPLTVVGPTPSIPYGLPETRNDGLFGPPGRTVPYQIWRPQESGFRMPRRSGLNEEALLDFLGNDFNSQLTSVDRPVGNAPKACNLLPALEGSAGQQLIHVEMEDESISLLAPDDMGLLSLIYNQTVADPTLGDDVPERSEFESGVDFDEVSQIITQTNSKPELCDIWVAKCPLVPTWIDIGVSFFPQYLAQSVCSGKNCSIPRGLTCQEDFTYNVYVTVLRWDCCFNHLGLETRWDCGWRKVRVPIFCDCTCNCREVPSHV